MLVIRFPPNAVIGGYGDRVVGLIAVRVMSAVLGRPFYIRWDKEDVRPFIDYAAYDFANIASDEDESARVYDLIDRQQMLKKYLAQSPDVFPDPVTVFWLNQEIAQYLYQNPVWGRGRDDLHDMLQAYAELYTHLLKPTPLVLANVQSLLAPQPSTSAPATIIGIQVRCGDKYIPNNREDHTTGILEQLPALLPRIRRHCDARHGEGAYAVFVTSDHDAVVHECRRVWPGDNVLYNPDPIQHMDRPVVHRADLSKIFVDNFVLARRTAALYISPCSNYGRIAALSAPHNLVFDLECTPLAKRDLLSKHEMLT